MPDDTLVFKVDAFPAPHSFFNDVNGVRKRADYVLLAQKADKKRALFIEMKRTKGKEHEIHAQLRGAACVLDYCNAILARFFGENSIAKGFAERYVSIGGNQQKNLLETIMWLTEMPQSMIRQNECRNLKVIHLPINN